MARISLAGRSALITGAARRVGRSIALALAQEGVNIILHHRGSHEAAAELQTLLVQKNVRCWIVEADFENENSLAKLITESRTLAGEFNILINNASIFPEDTLETMTFENLMENFKVNAWAPMALSRGFAAFQHTPANPGQIINLLDTRVWSYDLNHASYIFSKHMLTVYTRMAAMAFAPRVLVNGIAPGLILPPAGRGPDYLERLAGTTPLKRAGTPDDVAAAVVYLLKNDYVTGEVIHVDGGRHLRE